MTRLSLNLADFYQPTVWRGKVFGWLCVYAFLSFVCSGCNFWIIFGMQAISSVCLGHQVCISRLLYQGQGHRRKTVSVCLICGWSAFNPFSSTIFWLWQKWVYQSIQRHIGNNLPFYHATACNATHSIALAIRPYICPSVCLSDACTVTKLNDALRIF